MEKMRDKKVALICHTFNPFLNRTPDHPFQNLGCWSFVNPLKYEFEYKGFNGKAHLFTHKECDIYFTVPTIPTIGMASLYHSADVGIQVSRGEGWDLPLVEMLACGIPTIATNCMGHSEYLENDLIPKIQSELIIQNKEEELAVDNIWFKGESGTWEVLDKEKFESLLELTYNNQQNYTKIEELADYMSQNYSWSKAAEKLLETINKYKKD